MKKYIPLHVHSHYSLLDGLSKPAQIAQRCADIGVESCAITDHGTISGSVQFYQSMKAKNIKPILGCEIYLSHQDANIKSKENSKLSHFLLLSKNLKGWKNLIKIVSESNTIDNFYRKPRLDLNQLQSLLDGNIIGICGHLGSYLADVLSSSRDTVTKEGVETVARLKDIFGKNNFFLESQLMDREHTPEQIELTNHIRDLSKLTDTKVVCTPDAHYCKQDDAVDQRILL
jgi:DNA polymerase-3 subunit alpha